jgi:hypothetical protein
VLHLCTLLVGDDPVDTHAHDETRLTGTSTVEEHPPFAGGRTKARPRAQPARCPVTARRARYAGNEWKREYRVGSGLAVG